MGRWALSLREERMNANICPSWACNPNSIIPAPDSPAKSCVLGTSSEQRHEGLSGGSCFSGKAPFLWNFLYWQQSHLAPTSACPHLKDVFREINSCTGRHDREEEEHLRMHFTYLREIWWGSAWTRVWGLQQVHRNSCPLILESQSPSSPPVGHRVLFYNLWTQTDRPFTFTDITRTTWYGPVHLSDSWLGLTFSCQVFTNTWSPSSTWGFFKSSCSLGRICSPYHQSSCWNLPRSVICFRSILVSSSKNKS